MGGAAAVGLSPGADAERDHPETEGRNDVLADSTARHDARNPRDRHRTSNDVALTGVDGSRGQRLRDRAGSPSTWCARSATCSGAGARRRPHRGDRRRQGRSALTIAHNVAWRSARSRWIPWSPISTLPSFFCLDYNQICRALPRPCSRLVRFSVHRPPLSKCTDHSVLWRPRRSTASSISAGKRRCDLLTRCTTMPASCSTFPHQWSG